MATLFGKPLNTLFDSDAVRSIATSTIGGVVGGIGEYWLRHRGESDVVSGAVKQGAVWGAVDFGLELGVQTLFPGVRQASAFQSAMVDVALQTPAGALTGYQLAKHRGDDNPMRNAAITAAEWGGEAFVTEYLMSAALPWLRGIKK